MARFLATKDEWFTDDIKNLDDENIYRKLQGHWIIEFSEMLATANTKTVEAIKAFLSRQKDTYKVPYDKYEHGRSLKDDGEAPCRYCKESSTKQGYFGL